MSLPPDAVSEAEYILGREDDDAIGQTVMAEVPVTISLTSKKNKDQTPQQIIDEFWAKFTTKAPGKGSWRCIVLYCVTCLKQPLGRAKEDVPSADMLPTPQQQPSSPPTNMPSGQHADRIRLSARRPRRRTRRQRQSARPRSPRS